MRLARVFCYEHCFLLFFGAEKESTLVESPFQFVSRAYPNSSPIHGRVSNVTVDHDIWNDNLIGGGIIFPRQYHAMTRSFEEIEVPSEE